VPAAQAAAPASDALVEGLLAKMTLEEKLGQLHQGRGGRNKALNSLVDDAERAKVRKGLVGSYLHVNGAAFTRELQRLAVEESRLHVPLLFAMDIIHGYRTTFPVPLAMAASWDPSVVERAARVAAVEATAAGLHWTFSPMVDIARDPRWGRIVEGAGEDPYLGRAMAAAYVRGYQGRDLRAKDSLLACVKHFAGYGAAIGGRDYDSADVSERTLREVYLPPFQAAVDAGALTVMSAFQDLNGVPMTANRRYLTGVLRGEWGFRGFVVSDWESVLELMNHGVAGTPSEAGKLALVAGTDMDMTANVYVTYLAPLVRAGAVPMAAVDEAVRRVLRVKQALGLFDDPYRGVAPEREKTDIMNAGQVATAREVARRSIVLLKNERRTLPLAKSIARLAVIGPLADDRQSPLGSWRARGQADDVVTVLEGLRRALPRAKIEHVAGVALDGTDERDIPKAVAAARRAQAVVLVVGESFDATGESRSRSTLELPGPQQKLADAVLAAGRPTAVLLMNGRPLAIGPLLARAPAVVEAFYLGVQMGPAVADVLLGDANPGGKLPVAFPRATGQVPLPYAHNNTGRPADEDLTKDTARYHDLPTTPLLPFGHGLSYTTFRYGALSVTPTRAASGATVDVRVPVENDGPVAGDEVVQLYVRDPVASVARPVQLLRGFARVTLAPGQRATVRFALPVDELGFWDDALAYAVEPGEIQLMAGSSSADIRARGTLTVTGSRVVLPHPHPKLSAVTAESR
jgi:beta-glucosidase